MKTSLIEPAVFVQVRYSSSRLPGKVLMKIGEMTLIERLYDRLSFFLDLPIVFLTSVHVSDNIIEKHCTEKGIPVFRGDLHNVLNRYVCAGEQLGHEAFFRVTGDNPFVDAAVMAEYWRNFTKFDYVDNIHKDGNAIGTGFEFVKLDVLKSIPQPVSLYDKEHVTTYLRRHSDKYKSWRFLPDDKKKSKELFLTCDYQQDFWLIEEIYSYFQFSNYMKVEDVLSFLNENRHLITINQQVHNLPDY